MLRSTRCLAAVATALLVGTAAPAAAQSSSTLPPATPQPSLAEGAESALDWLRLVTTQVGLVALRFFADVRYEDVVLVPGTGAVLVTDLEVTIPVPYSPPRSCTVTVGAYEAQQSALGLLVSVLGTSTVRLEDVTVPLACLPLPAQSMIQMAQLREIVVDELRLSTEYDLTTAGAELGLRASIRDVADLDLRAELDYAFVLLQFPDPSDDEDPFSGDEEADPEPVPSIEFGPVDLTIIDRGLVERSTPFLNMAGVPAEQLPGIAADGLRAALGALPLADDVEREVERFLTEGGRLSIALRPGELWLNQIEDMDPAAIVAAFNPSVGSATRPDVLSLELIEAASGSLVRPEQAIPVARAFLTGEGMPRNPARAFEIIEAAASTFGTDYAAEAREIAARALLAGDGDVQTAYRMAIEAGAEGRDVSSLLRAAEARLAPDAIARTQELTLTQWEATDASTELADRVVAAIRSGDTAILLDLARRYERGIGVPRNVASSFGFALLAEVAGEVGATPLVERIEATASASDAARDAWADVLEDARNEATTIWLESGLARMIAERSQ